jgi:hypothetical protein
MDEQKKAVIILLSGGPKSTREVGALLYDVCARKFLVKAPVSSAADRKKAWARKLLSRMAGEGLLQRREDGRFEVTEKGKEG